jgi:hypothetical protein
MKVPRTKIEGAVSTDAARPVLTHVFLRVVERVTGRGRSRRIHKEGFLEATDSYILARTSVELDDGDVEGLIPVEALERAREKGLFTIDVGESVRVDRVTFERPPGTWPDVDKIIPGDDKIVIAVGLNAKFLMKLAEALGTKGEVRLELSGEATRTKAGRLQGVRVIPGEPIRVKTLDDNNVGALMPIKLSSYPLADEWWPEKS